MDAQSDDPSASKDDTLHVEVRDFAATNHTSLTELGGVVIPLSLLLEKRWNSQRSIWMLAATLAASRRPINTALPLLYIIYEGGGDGRR